MDRPRFSRADLASSPMLAFYEITRACDLACVHCRASAQCHRDPFELDSIQSMALIEQLTRFPTPPLLVLTGGDPLKREDVFDLVAHARQQGLEVAMTPSATPLVTPAALQRLKEAGLHRLAVSLDAADAATHDAFRQVRGSFARTMEILADAKSAVLPLQVNTTLTRHNFNQLPAIADLLESTGIVLWSVFFLIPTGRGQADQRLSADQCEEAFAALHSQSFRRPFAIKTTEAPHYRRFILQRTKASRVDLASPGMAGTNDGKGILFVSHRGEIFPSGFLPIECGRFPRDSVVQVYQESPLFKALRDSDQLGGKCGVCEYRHLCGGSRARSYAVTGDPLAAELDCAFLPVRWQSAPKRKQALPVCV